MTKKIKNYPMLATVTAFVLALAPSLSQAETWHTSKIKSVYPTGSGNILLIVTTAANAKCLNPNPGYFTMVVGTNGVDAQGMKNIYAAALTALATGKSVNINFDENSSACYIDRLIAGP